ncbi:MAG: peptidylprolyl isomerase [Planctomycetota bacterium]
MRVTLAVTALLLPLTFTAVAAAQEDLPEDVAAAYQGEEISRSEVHRQLATRYLARSRQGRMLGRFLSDRVAADELERRGIVVDEEAVKAKVEETRKLAAEQMKRYGDGGGEKDSLERFLRESGYTLEEFREKTRHYLGLQMMAREDLGATGEVPNPQIELWLKDLKSRREVLLDPEKLRSGEIARIGERPVRREEFGRWLVRNVPRTETHGVVLDIAFSLAVERRADEKEVVLQEEDLNAEIQRLRDEFADQPRVQGSGITFEAWLREVRGMSVEDLRDDSRFRTAILGRKVVVSLLTEKDLEMEWERNGHRYSARARIRKILVKGEEKAGRFGVAARPMLEAKRIADRAIDELESGRPFEAVAKRYSEDFPPDGPRGQMFEVGKTAQSTALPQAVIDRVFEAEKGSTVGPIKAVDGWHIVHVERIKPAPTYEEAKPQIRRNVASRQIGMWRLELRNDETLRIAPAYSIE